MKTTLLVLSSLLALDVWAGEAIVPQYPQREAVQITVVFQSQRQTLRTCNDLGAWKTPVPLTVRRAGNEAVGCVVINNEDKSGTVYAPRINDMDDTAAFATLGHEVLHVLIGEYHGK